MVPGPGVLGWLLYLVPALLPMEDSTQGFTYGVYKCEGFQHYMTVQGPLRCIQERPLLLGEVHSHVLKGHQALQQQEQDRLCYGCGRQEPVS